MDHPPFRVSVHHIHERNHVRLVDSCRLKAQLLGIRKLLSVATNEGGFKRASTAKEVVRVVLQVQPMPTSYHRDKSNVKSIYIY